MAEPEEMEKAERAQAARARRFTAVKRFFVAVAIDSVPAVVVLVSLLIGGALAYYAPALFRSAIGFQMPRGVQVLVMFFTLGLPVVVGPKFVAWWRDKTGRPWC
jgi:hypothetical protein